MQHYYVQELYQDNPKTYIPAAKVIESEIWHQM